MRNFALRITMSPVLKKRRGMGDNDNMGSCLDVACNAYFGINGKGINRS